MKYFRYDLENQVFKLVRINSGGGARFIDITEATTLMELKFAAMDLYFENGVNHFFESINDCFFTICDPGLLECDETLKVMDVIRKKCMQLSKTFFVLKSESLLNHEVEVEESTYNKRKI